LRNGSGQFQEIHELHEADTKNTKWVEGGAQLFMRPPDGFHRGEHCRGFEDSLPCSDHVSRALRYGEVPDTVWGQKDFPYHDANRGREEAGDKK